MHIAAMVQGGTSGGPWMDARGRVIGVQSGTMREQNSPAGIAKIVPLAALRTLLTTRRNAATPTFGAAVEELWQHTHDVLKRFPPRTEALVLRQVQPDGPAARAGLKEWDAITAADGQRVRLTAELLRIVRAKKPGETLKLDVLAPDGAGTRQVEVQLGRLEVGWPEAREAEPAKG
jgi:S1-C subfamily serine protease